MDTYTMFKMFYCKIWENIKTWIYRNIAQAHFSVKTFTKVGQISKYRCGVENEEENSFVEHVYS